MNDTWDPQQYDRFRQERQQPFFDLLKLTVPRPDARIIDLGCGTGDLTRELHRTWRAKETLGIDSSEAMLKQAATVPSKPEDAGLRLEQRRIEELNPAGRSWDLVFSNAALHWVADHPALFEKLAGLVGDNGQLAVQMPANDTHPSHRLVDEVAAEEPLLAGLRTPKHVLPVEDYARLLYKLGFKQQTVRMQVYGHVLPSSADVLEWTKGTTLTPFRKKLDDAAYDRLLSRYAARLKAELGDTKPYFYAFKRILLWGAR